MRRNIKRIACLTLAVLLLGGAWGCGSSTGDEGKDVDMAALMDAMIAADPTLPDLTRVTSDGDQAASDFTYLSDLDYKLIDEYFNGITIKDLMQEDADHSNKVDRSFLAASL